MATRNLTLAIDEDLLDKARVLAAIRRTSVNDMVREFLMRETSEVSRDARRAEWQALFDKLDTEATDRRKRMEGGLPSRDELYDEVMRERGLP